MLFDDRRENCLIFSNVRFFANQLRQPNLNLRFLVFFFDFCVWVYFCACIIEGLCHYLLPATADKLYPELALASPTGSLRPDALRTSAGRFKPILIILLGFRNAKSFLFYFDPKTARSMIEKRNLQQLSTLFQISPPAALIFIALICGDLCCIFT